MEVIHQGHVQRMTAGTGITHSEFNASDSEPVHLLQIWILPNQQGLKPSYEDGFFTDAQKMNQWCLLVSQQAKADSAQQGSLRVHQDMALLATKLDAEKQLDYALKFSRNAYVQVASGSIEIDGEQLNAGDAALFDAAELIHIKAISHTEVLLFDLPKA